MSSTEASERALRVVIEAALAAARAQGRYDVLRWRPIETAPTDGTAVLVYAGPREGLPAFCTVASWNEDAGWCVDELRYATHWIPIPPVPMLDRGGEGR